MKSLDAAFAVHLASGTTTLAHVWIVKRLDGVTLGFTDHDRDLTVDGIACRAVAGFTASAIEDQLGLAVSNLDVAGALSDASLSESDIADGCYDGALVRILRVNWAAPEQGTELRRGTLGRITRGRTAFTAELRGLAAALDQPAGRSYGRDCAWSLGDQRCRVTVTTTSATIAAIPSAFALRLSGLAAAVDSAAHGLITLTSGMGRGLHAAILSAAADGADLTLELTLPVPSGVAAGDSLTLSPGCDRQFATCRDRFGNSVNFGGFPHMPGNDFVLANAQQSDDNDGSALT